MKGQLLPHEAEVLKRRVHDLIIERDRITAEIEWTRQNLKEHCPHAKTDPYEFLKLRGQRCKVCGAIDMGHGWSAGL